MPAKITFDHQTKETITQTTEDMLWEQKFANKEGFTALKMYRYFDKWNEDPVKAQKDEYYKIVWEYTEQNAPNVPNIEKRSYEYHVDHIIPIYYGYKNSIDPEIIGGLANLQILPRYENCVVKKHYYTPPENNGNTPFPSTPS